MWEVSMSPFRKTVQDDANNLSFRVIGAAIEVHRMLGPGLLESVYETCLCHELSSLEIGFRRQPQVPISYKGVFLDCPVRPDLIVEDMVVVELKAVDQLQTIHEAQLLTFLRLLNLWLGLLINFNVEILINRIVRKVNG
jgi:GxxExxY protein